MTTKLIIDSHLHIWANSVEASHGFPYAEGQEPPESLAEVGCASYLLQSMHESGVDGALIVQPINHKFDHSYVLSAIKAHPTQFKGMLLHNPSLSVEDAVSTLEDLVLKGFVGVRFNPYLWPKVGTQSWKPMSTPGEGGLAVYQRCAELKIPVGIMCFQGLEIHYDDVLELLKASPQTTMVLDHFGFTSFTPQGDQAFQKLLKLAVYPQVVVKISALFRLNDEAPYKRVKTERFDPLLTAFGAGRLMFGSDYPFVLEQTSGYGGTKELVSSWIEDKAAEDLIMGGTAQRLFGAWGSPSVRATE